MAIMSCLITAAVMALAAAASPVIQDGGIISDPNCSSICASASADDPFEKSACIGVPLGDENCAPVFFNLGIGTFVPEGDETNHTTGVNTQKRGAGPATKEQNDNGSSSSGSGHALLSKRSHFYNTEKPEKLCGRASKTCFFRDQSALVDDCKSILIALDNWRGYWAVSKNDVAGQMYHSLMATRTCVLAVTHPNDKAIHDVTKIGNLDLQQIIILAMDKANGYCIKDGMMEVRGMTECQPWPLTYWITNNNKFGCCKVDRPGK